MWQENESILLLFPFLFNNIFSSFPYTNDFGEEAMVPVACHTICVLMNNMTHHFHFMGVCLVCWVWKTLLIHWTWCVIWRCAIDRRMHLNTSHSPFSTQHLKTHVEANIKFHECIDMFGLSSSVICLLWSSVLCSITWSWLWKFREAHFPIK